MRGSSRDFERAIKAIFRLFPEFDMIEWDGKMLTVYYLDHTVNPRSWEDFEIYSSAREILRELERRLEYEDIVPKTWVRY